MNLWFDEDIWNNLCHISIELFVDNSDRSEMMNCLSNEFLFDDKLTCWRKRVVGSLNKDEWKSFRSILRICWSSKICRRIVVEYEPVWPEKENQCEKRKWEMKTNEKELEEIFVELFDEEMNNYKD